MRAVVADDSVLLREGIVRLLEDGGIEVVGQAADGEELLALVDRHRPDVALVDIRMPPGQSDEGLRAATRIREVHGEAIGILFLSQFAEPDLAFRALAIGDRGVGYLLKERVRDVDELRDALARVAGGGFVVDPEVVARLVDRRRQADPLDTLSAREREVLALMAEGRTNQAIADRLSLALKTVEAYVAAIFSKLGLEPGPADHRRVLAVLAWLRAT